MKRDRGQEAKKERSWAEREKIRSRRKEGGKKGGKV